MSYFTVPVEWLLSQLDAWQTSTAAQLGITIDELAERYELIESPSEIITKADGSLVVRAIYRLGVKK